jgi:hypothetical protein
MSMRYARYDHYMTYHIQVLCSISHAEFLNDFREGHVRLGSPRAPSDVG